MGWKAAQKLIHHWKILRGDNVRRQIVYCLFKSCMFQKIEGKKNHTLYLNSLLIILSLLLFTGNDN